MIPKHMGSIVEQVREWVAEQDATRKAGRSPANLVSLDLNLAQARWVGHVLAAALAEDARESKGVDA